MAIRVTFVIDGFNLYHSIRDVHREIGVNSRWLDLSSLCETIVSSSMGPGHAVDAVHYFSALARHTDPTGHGPAARHRVFIRALEASGVTIHMGRFKKKTAKCGVFREPTLVDDSPVACEKSSGTPCNGKYVTWEEKETDVAMACEIMELALTDATEHIVIVLAGDTDLLPAIRRVRELRPSLEVTVAFPHGRLRHNKDLADAASRKLSLTPALYASHQFPDPYLPPGESPPITKPVGW